MVCGMVESGGMVVGGMVGGWNGFPWNGWVEKVNFVLFVGIRVVEGPSNDNLIVATNQGY